MPETAGGFAYTSLFRQGLPAPAARFTGHAKYNFIGGHNDPEQIPVDALATAAADVVRRFGPQLAMYNLGQGPQGYPALRDFVADKLSRLRGIPCTRDDILITSGSTQGIDLVNSIFVQAGDTVIIEEFSYSSSIERIRRIGGKVVGAPLDQGGLDIDALASLLARLKKDGVKPKYIYTIPTIQNPTGTILSLERRHKLLALAKQYGVLIFEDECYADLVWSRTAPPALYGLDKSQVVHIGSFSKSLAPALRLGYLTADWQLLSQILACKNDAGTGALDQLVAAEYFSANFDKHIDKLSTALEGKLDTMVEALQQEFGTSVEFHRPVGGIFLWMKLPAKVDVRKLVGPAAKAGIVFNPGPEWSCDGEAAKSHMRLCFALPDKATIRKGVAELARVCFEETGIPVRSGNIARQ